MSGYTNEQKESFMREALREANKAFELGEVPVGAVIVWEGVIVASAHNERETGKNALYHAELLAINEACKKLGGWRLHKADLFVTVEPCYMCAGACVSARIKNVYYGCGDTRFGGFGGVLDLRALELTHRPDVEGGILEDECALLMRRFFLKLREKRN